jgi:hypothetical protein
MSWPARVLILGCVVVSFACAARPGETGGPLPGYQNGTIPSTIAFSLSVTNQYVNANPVPMQIDVSNGGPLDMAILVDSKNFAGATWMACNFSNFEVNLGQDEGWHDVWVGLREQTETSRKTQWECKRLRLDRTPPRLVITKPVSLIVSQPVIELQGYCPEPLFRISYDLTNAAGLVTNQQAFVLYQFFDTNTWEFTTNWFQGFDIEVTDGPNTFTFHATDLAGNVTTTNITFTLDYSGKTNPPIIQLYWPQDGTQIAGTNSYTWRGWVEDFTATVTAALVDTNGNTNVYNALVERDGKFWVENLPAPLGTNWLQLTVQDVMGNVSVTNITVVNSPLLLTVNPQPVTADQAYATVTGTINSIEYTVWVNGVKAQLNSDGSWIATNVPVSEGGTSVFQARAIPNWDHGGNGTPP